MAEVRRDEREVTNEHAIAGSISARDIARYAVRRDRTNRVGSIMRVRPEVAARLPSGARPSRPAQARTLAGHRALESLR